MTAQNIAYEEKRDRSFFALNLASFSLTLGALLMVLISLGVMIVLPAALGYVGVDRFVENTIFVTRWPLLFVVGSFAIAVLYRYEPCRSIPPWRWASWGATMATVLWIIGSASPITFPISDVSTRHAARLAPS